LREYRTRNVLRDPVEPDDRSAADEVEHARILARHRARSLATRLRALDSLPVYVRAVEFGVLGPLAVWKEGTEVSLGAARQRGVLGILRLRANQPVSSAGLVDELWAERPPATAVKATQVYVSQLRKLLGEGSIETQRAGYLLRVEPGAVDRDRFEG